MKFFTILFAGWFLAGVQPQENRLQLVKQRGTVVVATRNAPAIHEQVEDTRFGFEFELARSFAEHLGVDLDLRTFSSEREVIAAVAAGESDIGAAGLAHTADFATELRFGPAYQNVTEQLGYRPGRKKPSSLAELATGQLQVEPGSAHISTLRALSNELTALTWHENQNAEKGEILQRVAQGTIDFTIANSNEAALMRRLHPDLAVALDLGESHPLAWALQRSRDDSLYFEVLRFFDDYAKSGDLDRLLERYYGNIGTFDYVGAKRFLRHVRDRLPALRDHFKEAGLFYSADWRLLAAIGYQESHWRADAVSPTGVRGIMMLTRATARQVGVTDRLDPRQSIDGGTRYIRQIKAKIPRRIEEPDRTWLALAAYNVGFGHLEDARILTQRAGRDPDRWSDVKQYLPLLADPTWHKLTRHGFARGHEPVRYVENVRRYHDTLISIDSARSNADS